MHVLVVASSAMPGPADLSSLSPPDLIILADGGADHLPRLDPALLAGRPLLLVGDMDSISRSAKRRVETAGGEVLTLPTAKDETDLEYALRVAVERGAEEISVLGALGGPRLDHLFGGIALLTASWLQGVKVRLLDEQHEVFLAQGEALIRGSAGDTVSLVPLTPEVQAVSTENLAYPLYRETLFEGSTRGISNVMQEAEARVHHGAGRLLVLHYRDSGAAGPQGGAGASGESVVAAAGGVTEAGRWPGASLACQFSLYPLRQQSIDEAIRAGIEEATRTGAASGMSVKVQPLSTLLQGGRDVVFAALRAAFDAAESHGSVVMVCALTPVAPSDEVLSDIQERNIDAWSTGSRTADH